MKIKDILELSALILSMVNGLMLLKYYMRDRAKLSVDPIHPEVYQWWFKLPSGVLENQPTRKYGFIAYIGISNAGLRKVSLNSWRLFIKDTTGKRIELKAIGMPEPSAKLGASEVMKCWPVLGQKGVYFSGETLVDSGTSIAGMTYYIAESYGKEELLAIANDKIKGKIVIRDIFGGRASCKIIFLEKPLEEIKKMIPDIEKIA